MSVASKSIWTFKGIFHQIFLNSVIMYLTSRCSKPFKLSFFYSTQKKTI